MSERAPRWRGERGEAVIELPAAVVFILFPVAILLMVLPQWPERQGVARSVAHEAAVAMANAASFDDGAARVAQLVTEATANHGYRAGSLRLSWSGQWCRRCSVTATVTVEIPAVQVPIMGSTGAFSWSTGATQRIDDYRSIGA